MAKNITEIPFTELVERVSEIARERVDARSKVRGAINDMYTRELARKFDWTFFLAQSTITVQGQYNTGTVSATTGSTSVTFSPDVVLTASNNLWWLKISGNDYIYQYTFSQTSSGALNVPFGGTVNQTNTTYNLFQPYYSLATDFDRFPKNGGLIAFYGGTERIVQELAYQDWAVYYSPTPTQYATYVRLYGVDTAGNTLMELTPPPSTALSYRYDYFVKPQALRETTAGFVAIAANANTVFCDPNVQTGEISTGNYFRVDALGKGSDSSWYRILAINGTALTLQTSFANTAITSANYTVCSAPQMPSKMHPALLYGGILQLCVDQNDPMAQMYNTKLAEVLSDGKRLYVSRIYSQDIHHLGEEYLYRR